VCELFASYERAASAYDLARKLREDDRRAQLRLIARIGVVCERQARYADALEWYDRGLALVDEGDVAHRAELELGIAAVRHHQGDSEDAIRWAERAAAHAEEAGAHASLAHAYFLLDLAHTTVGRPKDEYRKRALPIYRETGDLVGQANVLNNLGIGAYYEGRWDEALELYRESGEASRRAGDVLGGARASSNAAEILSDQGKLKTAVEIFADARRIWRAGRYPIGAHFATSSLGRAAAREGRFDEALRLLEEARRGFAEIGAAAFELEARAREAECLVLAGRYQEALEVCDEALPRAAGVAGTEVAHVELRRSLGYALVQSRRADEARVHLEESARLARAMHLDYELALSLKALVDTGVAADASVSAEAQTILARLGVVEVPSPPLP
jgi:tetratricopeptide (TPR) repeat protein